MAELVGRYRPSSRYDAYVRSCARKHSYFPVYMYNRNDEVKVQKDFLNLSFHYYLNIVRNIIIQLILYSNRNRNNLFVSYLLTQILLFFVSLNQVIIMFIHRNNLYILFEYLNEYCFQVYSLE